MVGFKTYTKPYGPVMAELVLVADSRLANFTQWASGQFLSTKKRRTCLEHAYF